MLVKANDSSNEAEEKVYTSSTSEGCRCPFGCSELQVGSDRAWLLLSLKFANTEATILRTASVSNCEKRQFERAWANLPRHLSGQNQSDEIKTSREHDYQAVHRKGK